MTAQIQSMDPPEFFGERDRWRTVAFAGGLPFCITLNSPGQTQHRDLG